MTDFSKTVKDVAKEAAYITVGFGVIGVQRAQVRRQELKRQLDAQRQQFETQMTEVRGQVQKLVQDLDERLQPVRTEFESRINEFEGRLPEQARDFVQQVRTLAKETETQARKVFFDGQAA
jgi:DNA anti-recombination protein RmuC